MWNSEGLSPNPQKAVLRVGWSLVRSSLRIKHIQRNHSEDAGWPENVANVQTFPPAGFVCLLYQYSTKEVLFCFKFELLIVQPCWFAIHQ